MKYKFSIVALISASLVSCGATQSVPSSQKSVEREIQLYNRLQNSPEPELEFKNLTREEQHLVLNFLNNVTFETTSSVETWKPIHAQAGETCQSQNFVTKAMLINKVPSHEVSHLLRWCNNGKVLTKVQRTPSYQIYAPLIQFKGWVGDDNPVLGVGSREVVVTTTGAFRIEVSSINISEKTLKNQTRISMNN